MEKIKQGFLRGLLIFIKGYQFFVSPVLGQRCRFYPSCSQYAADALKVWGIRRGIWLATKRVCRCHPGCEGGYDPVQRCHPEQGE